MAACLAATTSVIAQTSGIGLSPDALTGSADIPVYAEYDKKLRSAEQLSPLASDLFGDVVSSYAGQTEFDNVDIDLPGNNALPVQLRRRFAISVLTEDQLSNGLGSRGNSYGGMGNWDIDVPFIYGVFDFQIGWDERSSSGGPAGTPRCSNHINIGTQTNMDGYIWSGNKVRIPGKGEREMVQVDSTYPPTHVPSASKNPKWTTREFDAFRCVPMSNGAYGEGFVMTTADGISYYFDYYRDRQYPGVSLGTARAGRKMIFLLATKVTDRYGNSVSYTYNGNGHPVSISSSDGRSISLAYDSTDPNVLSTASAHGRTWRYGYTRTQRDGARLTTVTLPDNLSKWSYDYTSLNPNDEYLYALYTPLDVGEQVCAAPEISGGRFNFKITHPSGSEGTFRFALKRFNRGMPSTQTGAFNCVVGPGGNRIFAKPPYVDSFAITEKSVTETDASSSTWQYLYRIGQGDTCFNNNCDTVKNRIIQPDGSAIDSTYWARFGATGGFVPAGTAIEGSLHKTEYWRAVGDSTPLRTEDYVYVTGPDVLDQSFTGYPFPSRYGSGGAAEDTASGSVRPLKTVTVTQQGVTFTRENQSFDDYARPLTVRMASSLGYSRTEATAYRDDSSSWVLGLIDSRTSPSFTSPIVKNFYDTKSNLTSVEEFGVLKRSMTYRTDGTLLTVYDGAHTTTLGTFKRGIPQSVTYADGASQSASVSDLGDILSVTDESGYTTSYGYDTLSRLTSITHPAGDSVAWNGTSIQYDRIASAEMGISGTHWRQTRTTGQGKKVTYYDQLLRPVVTEEYDAANRSGTQRYTLRRFDHANRETFVSYPSSTFAPTTGTTTQYDALGRAFKVMQDSELGVLTTQTDYLAPFKKQVTDPRNNITTTEFYAYDTPSEDAPKKITAPQGVTIDIVRDSVGKPRSVQRSGSYAGSTVSQIRRYAYHPSDQRLCKTIEPESGATIQDYDAAGNVSWSTKGSSLTADTCDRNSVPTADRTTYTYDARNRLLNTVFPTTLPAGTSPIAQTYWPDGALKTTSSNGATWAYSYNKRRLLETEALNYEGRDFLLDWGYDQNGSVMQLKYPDDALIDFMPNALGQPTKAGGYATGVTYFANGAIKGFTYGNSLVHSLTQNTRQLPLRSKDGVVADLTYEYDANANVTMITDGLLPSNDSRAMTYDGLDRLWTAYAPGVWGNASFGYDPLDNLRTSTVGIRSCTHAFNAATNRLASISGTNCPTLNYSYGDTRGNVTARGSQGFAFDRADRLIAATNKEAYAYDGLGRRVSVTPSSGSGKRYQVYSKDGQLLFGLDAATNKSTNYVYLNGSLVARSETNPQDSGLPPPPPPSVSPNPSASGNYTVTWQAIGEATSYVLGEVANGGTEVTYPISSSGGAPLPTSWSPQAPKPNGSYVYRVKACAGTCGNYSGTTTETVQIGSGALTLNPNPSTTGTYTVSWAVVPGAASYVLTESANGGAATTAYSGTLLSWTSPAKPDGNYTYRLQTCSGSCGTPSAPVTETVATGVPEGLDASPNPNTTGSYTVSWSAVASAVTYRLEEKVGASTWGEVQNSATRTRAFSSKPVGTYQYRVRACRHATDVGYCGAFQLEEDLLTVQVYAQPPTIPAPPTSLYGTPNPNTTGVYTVNWSASSGATSYALQEKYCYGDPVETCGSFQTVVSSTSGTSWSPPTPKTGYGKYIYQVKACNTAGCSGFKVSSPVKVLLPNVLPPSPVMVPFASPNPSTDGLYTVNWSASARATRYELQESVSGGTGTWTDLSTTLTGTSWATPTARPSGFFFYQARACNVYGCSPYSVSDAKAVVQIPAPVTMPTGFGMTGVALVNKPYKFHWDPVAGASHYVLKEEQFSCPTNGDEFDTHGANEPQPLIRYGRIPDCNGQPRQSVTFWYSLQACNGSVCSGWTPTVTVEISEGDLRPQGTTTTYIHTDGLRSPVAETDQTRLVTSRMRYEPYGAPTTGTYVQGPGYTGHVTDAATGLSYMQQRYYDPIAGRFLSTDPVAASAASFNRYAYALNNPYKYIDPDGRRIKIVGDDDFKKAVRDQIDKIKSKKEGAALVKKLEQSKNVITIREGKGENSTEPLDSKPGSKRPGVGSTIEFDPSKVSGPKDALGNKTRPPFVGLGHEMGHARALDLGIQSFDYGSGDPGTTPPAEIQSMRFENKIRAEHGIPLRPSYYEKDD